MIFENSTPRSSEIRAEEKRYPSREQELDAAIHTLQGLLHYHQRLVLVSDPNFMADTYEVALVTALECLKAERSRLS